MFMLVDICTGSLDLVNCHCVSLSHKNFHTFLSFKIDSIDAFHYSSSFDIYNDYKAIATIRNRAKLS